MPQYREFGKEVDDVQSHEEGGHFGGGGGGDDVFFRSRFGPAATVARARPGESLREQLWPRDRCHVARLGEPAAGADVRAAAPVWLGRYVRRCGRGPRADEARALQFSSASNRGGGAR